MNKISDWLNSPTMKNLNRDPFGSGSRGILIHPSKPVQVELKDGSLGSKLEIMFLDLWGTLGGPVLEREYRFHETRKWRLDFYHKASKTAVEIDGCIWIPNKSHSSGAGIARDIEKGNEMAYMGIHHFRLYKEIITCDNLKRIMAFMNGKTCTSRHADGPDLQVHEHKRQHCTHCIQQSH